MTKEQRNWMVGGIAVVVVLVLGWWFFTAPVQEASTNTNTNTQTTSTGSNTSTGASSDVRPTVEVNMGEEVHADDQPAGDSVRVVEAKLSRVSWLAVRDDMRIYGAAKVTPPTGGGTMSDITVPLLRNTESGKSYTVVVYADDGDGVFDFKKDSLVNGLDDSFSALNGD